MQTSGGLTRLLNYMRGHRKTVWLASICSVLNKAFDIAPEVLIGVAVDLVVSRENSWLAQLGVTDPFTQMWILGLITLIIWVLESFFEYAFSILWRNLAQ